MYVHVIITLTAAIVGVFGLLENAGGKGSPRRLAFSYFEVFDSASEKREEVCEVAVGRIGCGRLTLHLAAHVHPMMDLLEDVSEWPG